MTRLRIAVSALVAVGSTLVGCHTDQERQVTTMPIIIPRPGAEVSETEPIERPKPASKSKGPATSRADFERWLDDARGYAAAEDYQRALEVLDEIRRHPTLPFVARSAEALRVEVKQHLIQSTYVDALILLDHDRIALGDPLSGEFVLMNLAPDGLLIPAGGRAGKSGKLESATTLHVDIRHREYTLDGTLVDERSTWSVEVGEDIRLAPGERRSWPLRLDTLQFSPERPTYRTWRVDAMLYPAKILIGDEPFPGNLRFRSRTCEIFPRNFEHLQDDPVARLEEAVLKESPPHVPLAAALARDQGIDKPIQILLSILARPGGEPPAAPTRTSCCVALRILTGEDLPVDPQAWLEWARERELGSDGFERQSKWGGQ